MDIFCDQSNLELDILQSKIKDKCLYVVYILQYNECIFIQSI